MKILARPSSLRTTSTSVSSVRTRSPPALLALSRPDTHANARPAERNGRKTLTTVQGLPKKFDQKKILKVIKKKFACNGTIVVDTEMGEVIQLQGDQRKDVQEFLVDKKEGLGLDAKDIKVCLSAVSIRTCTERATNVCPGPRFLVDISYSHGPARSIISRSCWTVIDSCSRGPASDNAVGMR